MESVSKLLEKSQQELALPYQGALLPAEAYQILQQDKSVQLVDVRSQAEWDWVGRISGAIEIELRSYPGMQPNADFLNELAQKIDKTKPVFFLCRSGVRSNAAAAIACEAGFSRCYNILEGFEGDKDENGHRGNVSGWKAAGLPWMQS